MAPWRHSPRGIAQAGWQLEVAFMVVPANSTHSVSAFSAPAL